MSFSFFLNKIISVHLHQIFTLDSVVCLTFARFISLIYFGKSCWRTRDKTTFSSHTWKRKEATHSAAALDAPTKRTSLYLLRLPPARVGM
jgi:hypothetical protein